MKHRNRSWKIMFSIVIIVLFWASIKGKESHLVVIESASVIPSDSNPHSPEVRAAKRGFEMKKKRLKQLASSFTKTPNRESAKEKSGLSKPKLKKLSFIDSLRCQPKTAVENRYGYPVTAALDPYFEYQKFNYVYENRKRKEFGINYSQRNRVISVAFKHQVHKFNCK